MGKLILILGGARSGKSVFAEGLAKEQPRVAYIATAQITDEEMRQRVDHHRKRRPKHWTTYEAGTKLTSTLRSAAKIAPFIIVDCVTIHVTNLLMDTAGERGRHNFIIEQMEEVCATCKQIAATVVMVSNEVGMGIVPDTPLGREFRDLHGRVNQLVARASDEVYFVIAGIPQKIK